MQTRRTLLAALFILVPLVATWSPAAAQGTGGTGGGVGQTIKPGETGTGGGTTVVNDSDSGGKATLKTFGQGAQARTETTLRSDFSGKVEGLEPKDTVTCNSNVNATMRGRGGSITLAGQSEVRVHNEGNPDSDPPIVVTLPNGNTIEVYPGGKTRIRT